MKKIIIILIILLFTTNLFGISKNDFVLNVINENGFIKEIDSQVVVPFDSEYNLLLKNNNSRDCTARIWIDDALVSNFGDFIISANSELNLERFVTESMQKGKRFQFVTLDNPEVDDPSRKENGIIKVEFRLEKEYKPQIQYEYKGEYDGWYYYFLPFDINKIDCLGNTSDANVNIDFHSDYGFDTSTFSNMCSCTSTNATIGATIGGSNSDQSFTYANINVEDKVTTLRLTMKGLL